MPLTLPEIQDPEKGTSDHNDRATDDDPLTDNPDDFDDEDHDDLEDYPRNLTAEDNASKSPRKSVLLKPFTTLSSLSTPGKDRWTTRLKKLLFPGAPSSNDFESFVPNYRYTPILSGIVIPFSILLEIPGLTDRWYIRTDEHRIVETQPNSLLLDVGMAFSMACAVLANVCLVGRFLEWRVGLMTFLCVVFLTIHDTINIVAVTVFGIQHRFDDGFTYGQSFWMTVCSTVVSTFTNITLILDLVRTKNFEASGSGLTRKQRSLSIIIIVLLCYIALGALINTYLLKLSFINALYFSVITIESIGFGDVVPESPGARVFVCFYAIFGIVNLALAVGLIRETVLEGLEVGYYKRVQEVRRRRRVTTWKRRVVRRWHHAVSWRLTELNKPIWIQDDESVETIIVYSYRKLVVWLRAKLEDVASYVGLGMFAEKDGEIDGAKGSLANYKHPHLKCPRGMKLNLDALSQRQLESAAMEAGVPLAMLLPEDFWENRREQEKAKDKKRSHSRTSSGRFAIFTPPLSPRSTSSRDLPPSSTGDDATAVTAHDVINLKPQETLPGRSDLPLTHARLGRMVGMLGKFALAVDASGHLNGNVARPISTKKIAPANKGHTRNQSSASAMQGNQAGDPPRLPAKQSNYDLFQESVEEEEKRAFYSRLVVSVLLFLVFWTIGGVIFQATENWAYGEALYFCVIAFTTIGYGDFSPKTPAGRSIFVAWALLGVGTMTVLISIIAEAYSDRYKNALHSGEFFRAVKQYQSRSGDSDPFRKRRRGLPPSTLPPGTTPAHTAQALSEAEQRAKEKLEQLPHQMLRNAKAFHQHVQFFVGPNAKAKGNLEGVPEGLKRLMDEISGEEKLAERIKVEILQDDSARETLFTLGIEKALRRLIESAEEAIDALTERDHLNAAHQLAREQEGGLSPIEEMPRHLSSGNDHAEAEVADEGLPTVQIHERTDTERTIVS